METAGTTSEEKWTYLDVGGLVWRRKGRIAFGVFAGVALAVAACAVIGPWYESKACLLVIRKRLETTPLSGTSPGQPLEDYLSTHILIITSPKIVGRAVETDHLTELPCLRGKREPTREILDSLQVTRDPPKPGVVPSNEVLNLSFRGRTRDDCGRVLESIIDSYQKFLKETYQSQSAETLELIRRAKDEVEKDLKVKQDAYQLFRQSSPFIVQAKDGKLPQEDRLLVIDARRAALRVRGKELESALAAVDKVRRAGGTDGEVLQVLAAVRSDREMPAPEFLRSPGPRGAGGNQRGTLEEELGRLQLYEGELLGKWGQDHPDVQETRAQIRRLKELIVPSAGTPPRGGAWAQGLVAVKVELLRQDLNETRRVERVFDELFEQGQVEAKAAALLAMEDKYHREGIENEKALYDGVIKKLQEIGTVRDYGSFDTHVLAAPERGRWVVKKVLLVFGLGLLGGLLAGLAWACLAEVTDKSFRGPAEVGSRLKLAVLGHIPPVAAGAGGREAASEPMLYAYHRPDSQAAEACREVRTALLARTRAGGGRVIQVTSPDRGDGKTTLASNLAVSLAQSGRKVLLIDADFRTSRLAKVFRLSNEAGLASLLLGKAAAADVIRPMQVEGLSVLPSGPAPSSPAELLASPRLRQFFAEAGQTYDFVLVDTPPLIGVTDPMVVAAEADEVLLTLRLVRDARPRAERAKEILEAAGARVLGVVISGL